MPLVQIKYMSKVLRLSTDITVALPDYDPAQGTPGPYKALYLLHGFSGDSMDWLRNTNVERYAGEKGLAVVMPCGYNSAYTDMHYGMNYFTYLSEELPTLLQGMLPLSAKPEDNFVAGCSMGGYGAMKWGLTYPERFGGVVSFSGSLHVEDRIKGKSANSGNQCLGMYGCPPVVHKDTQELFHMLEEHVKRGTKLPPLYICCGTEDREHIYGAYCDFRDHGRKLGVDLTAEDGPGGHTWTFWEEYLQKVLDWLPL